MLFGKNWQLRQNKLFKPTQLDVTARDWLLQMAYIKGQAACKGTKFYGNGQTSKSACTEPYIAQLNG